ncbi:protein of unknown function [Candidatus Methylomirabilis oxygeniifera]|uniref:Uncharacterized protein n=1 Tax=Methylomirabilis oxygeniifera TaxID=671143 RepID=D5MLP0_METO1|nr:protein of unknown function [Candidatus Methylomirabilis oxyfera]
MRAPEGCVAISPFYPHEQWGRSQNISIALPTVRNDGRNRLIAKSSALLGGHGEP